jgi:hypothetical protein
MTLTVKQRITNFWLLAALAVGLLLATHEVRILHDYFDLTMFLPFLALWPAIMLIRRLTTDFRPPRWLRIYGWCVWAVVIVGVPALAVSRGPEAFLGIFVVGMAAAIAVYLLGVTAHAWRHRDDAA